MTKPKLQISVVVEQMFAENAFIAHLDDRKDCLVVDPGLDVNKILDFLDEKQLTPAAILNTHGHADHIGGNAGLKERWPDCPLVIGSGDAYKLTDPVGNLSANYGMSLVSPKADKLLDEGDTYEAAGVDLEIYDTPGHSAGHIVFVWKANDPWIVFGGDVLFRGSIGRTDFPDGDHDQLLASIRDKLFTLPDDTIVLPGHGEPTTVGQEKATNPFCHV